MKAADMGERAHDALSAVERRHQACILACLAERGGGMTETELAELMGVTCGAMNLPLTHLDMAGLIRLGWMRAPASDGKMHYRRTVEATPAGAEAGRHCLALEEAILRGRQA